MAWTAKSDNMQSRADTFDLLLSSHRIHEADLTRLCGGGSSGLARLLRSRDGQCNRLHETAKSLDGTLRRNIDVERKNARWWQSISLHVRLCFWTSWSADGLERAAPDLIMRCRDALQHLQHVRHWSASTLMCVSHILEVWTLLLMLGFVMADEDCQDASGWYIDLLSRLTGDSRESLVARETWSIWSTSQQQTYSDLLNRTCDVLSSVLARVPSSVVIDSQLTRLQIIMASSLTATANSQLLWRRPSLPMAAHVVAKIYTSQPSSRVDMWQRALGVLRLHLRSAREDYHTHQRSCAIDADRNHPGHTIFLSSSLQTLLHFTQVNMATSVDASKGSRKFNMISAPPSVGQQATPGDLVDQFALSIQAVEQQIVDLARHLLWRPPTASKDRAGVTPTVCALTPVLRQWMHDAAWPVTHILLRHMVQAVRTEMRESSGDVDTSKDLLQACVLLGSLCTPSSERATPSDAPIRVILERRGLMAQTPLRIYESTHWLSRLVDNSRIDMNDSRRVWMMIRRVATNQVDFILGLVQSFYVHAHPAVQSQAVHSVCRIALDWPDSTLVQSKTFNMVALLQVTKKNSAARKVFHELLQHATWTGEQLTQFLTYGIERHLQDPDLLHPALLWLLKLAQNSSYATCLPRMILAKLCLDHLCQQPPSPDARLIIEVLESLWGPMLIDLPLLAMQMADCVHTTEGELDVVISNFFHFCTLGPRSTSWTALMQYVVQQCSQIAGHKTTVTRPMTLFRAIARVRPDLVSLANWQALCEQAYRAGNMNVLQELIVHPLMCAEQFPSPHPMHGGGGPAESTQQPCLAEGSDVSEAVKPANSIDTGAIDAVEGDVDEGLNEDNSETIPSIRVAIPDRKHCKALSKSQRKCRDTLRRSGRLAAKQYRVRQEKISTNVEAKCG